MVQHEHIRMTERVRERLRFHQKHVATLSEHRHGAINHVIIFPHHHKIGFTTPFLALERQIKILLGLRHRSATQLLAGLSVPTRKFLRISQRHIHSLGNPPCITHTGRISIKIHVKWRHTLHPRMILSGNHLCGRYGTDNFVLRQPFDVNSSKFCLKLHVCRLHQRLLHLRNPLITVLFDRFFLQNPSDLQHTQPERHKILRGEPHFLLDIIMLPIKIADSLHQRGQLVKFRLPSRYSDLRIVHHDRRHNNIGRRKQHVRGNHILIA